MRIKSALKWVVFLGVFAGLVFGASNFQGILDWWNLKNYQPSQEVVKLADETTMKSGTRRIFYINHPQIDDKSQFNQDCNTKPEQTIVLGCFINHRGIYLLNVSDPKLNGVLEVTAAHETLHGIYARLSDKDKNHVDGLLEDYYKNDLTDQRIKDEINQYQKSEPNDVVNEMHSIFGTEISSLPAPLEDYYKQYFTDRSKIVQYSNQYEKAFNDIETQAKSYDSTLSGLKQQIDSNRIQINEQAAAIDQKQREMKSMLAQGDTKGYNDQVPEFNKLIDDYNALVDQTKQEINEYNDLVEKTNDLVLQQRQLYQEINSQDINTKSGK